MSHAEIILAELYQLGRESVIYAKALHTDDQMQIDDGQLMRRLRRGSREALDRVYRDHSQGMYTLAVSLTRDRSSADDIVHDVFVAFARAAARDEPIRNIKGYLLTAVANRSRSLIAARRRTAGVSDSMEIAGSERDGPALLIESEEHLRVWNALSEVPYEQQEVVLLKLRGGLTFKEIASIQEVSVSTAQGRYRYAIEKLRSILNHEVEK